MESCHTICSRRLAASGALSDSMVFATANDIATLNNTVVFATTDDLSGTENWLVYSGFEYIPINWGGRWDRHWC